LILSTRSRYGLKMMLELALNYGYGSISLNKIAERQLLSVTYLEQLISPLRKKGLVEGIRGSKGGYLLSKSPEEITVGEIIRLLEGPLAPSECVLDKEEFECINADNCATRLLWEKISESINTVIDGITLQDMVNDFNKLNPNKNIISEE
jgi:Rrf2 family cysteine metabolism transcriptional repressor